MDKNLENNLKSLIGSIAPLSESEISLIVARVRTTKAVKNELLFSQGMPNDSEYFLLNGLYRSLARDSQGREVTLDFHRGPAVITPNTARSHLGLSLLEVECLVPGNIAILNANKLTDLMVEFASIRQWGNAVMQASLERKHAHEWCLSALAAEKRLAWFREKFVGGEEAIPHIHIASYLGITPVTMSRLRRQSK